MSEVHDFFLAFFLVSATFCVFFFYILPTSRLCGLVFDANFRKFPVFLLLHFLRVVEFTNYKVPGNA